MKMAVESRLPAQTLSLRTLPAGPGFSSPSLSPESLAAFAYLHYLSKETGFDWVHVQDLQSSSTKNHDPVLDCICGAEISSFTNVVGHLRLCESVSGGEALSSWMNENELGDCEAFTSLALASGRQIVDLYLYATSANYVTTTRPAYSAFLPLHVNYTLPPAQRQLALSRTNHLGLDHVLRSSSDDDNTETPVRVQTNSFASNLPDQLNLSKWKNDLSASQKRLRLEKIISKSVGPLAELLGRKKFFLSESHPSVLDAVVVGYYGLLFSVKVQDEWAVTIIQHKYPDFADWLKTSSTEVFKQSHSSS